MIDAIRLRLVAGQHQDGDARLWLVEPWFRYHTFMSRPRKRRRQPDQSSAGPSLLVSTYQARIAVYTGRDRADGDAGLSAYGKVPVVRATQGQETLAWVCRRRPKRSTSATQPAVRRAHAARTNSLHASSSEIS